MPGPFKPLNILSARFSRFGTPGNQGLRITLVTSAGKRRNFACLRLRFGDYISDRMGGGSGAGRVHQLTSAATQKPVGTPKTPAEIGWMPNHSPSASTQLGSARIAATCESM